MSPGFGFNWIRAARRWVLNHYPPNCTGPFLPLVAFGDFGVEGDAVLSDDFHNLPAIRCDLNLEQFGFRGGNLDIPYRLQVGFGVGVAELQGDTLFLGLVLDILDGLAEALVLRHILGIHSVHRGLADDEAVEVIAIIVEVGDVI